MKQFGFLPPEVKQEDYRFGGVTKLKGEVLTDGHWRMYLPKSELQARNFDTNGCTSFGTLNCLEILWKRLQGNERNFSERFSAVLSENTREGNDPNKVAEAARKKGLLDDDKLPFSLDIDSWEKWASPNPMTQDLLDEAHKFIDLNDIGHEWVNANPNAMMDALKFSPLGVSVVAWYERNGKFYFPPGLPHTHWVCLFDYSFGDYWEVFDSYDKTIKRLEWNVPFVYVKRYALGKSIRLSILEQIVATLVKLVPILAFLVKKTEPLPVQTEEKPKSKIEAWAMAIQREEGWSEGSRSYRNNNPGNLRYTPYTASLGATSSDGGNFCIFPTYKDGFIGLCRFLTDAAQNKLKHYKDVDILTFTRIYAEPPIGSKYAYNVARTLGVPVQTKIKELL